MPATRTSGARPAQSRMRSLAARVTCSSSRMLTCGQQRSNRPSPRSLLARRGRSRSCTCTASTVGQHNRSTTASPSQHSYAARAPRTEVSPAAASSCCPATYTTRFRSTVGSSVGDAKTNPGGVRSERSPAHHSDHTRACGICGTHRSPDRAATRTSSPNSSLRNTGQPRKTRCECDRSWRAHAGTTQDRH